MARSLLAVKARRVIRRSFMAALQCFCEPVFNASQLITLAVGLVGTALFIQTASFTEIAREMSGWVIAAQAFGIVLAFWAAVSLIRAPFLVVKKDRAAAAWHERQRIYFKPELVALVPFTCEQRDQVAEIIFDDAEPNSLVSYSIELDPPVAARASSYLEQAPGQLDQIHSAIMFVNRATGQVSESRLGGRGSVTLSGRKAYLRVKLDAETVPVVARVFMHSFEV